MKRTPFTKLRNTKNFGTKSWKARSPRELDKQISRFKVFDLESYSVILSVPGCRARCSLRGSHLSALQLHILQPNLHLRRSWWCQSLTDLNDHVASCIDCLTLWFLRCPNKAERNLSVRIVYSLAMNMTKENPAFVDDICTEKGIAFITLRFLDTFHHFHSIVLLHALHDTLDAAFAVFCAEAGSHWSSCWICACLLQNPPAASWSRHLT